MGLTVRITLMTAPITNVLMEELVWMESTPTTVSALLNGLVRLLFEQLLLWGFPCASLQKIKTLKNAQYFV